eukprot:CAMPEP_0170173768 /NCGR_PEP_ID=MMETSP0040_2-20121228/7034_1 /TAXON_ID=641309 /ORGANISM="Lotharella oceanica, Strain CCMP622" /LENGTH=209 /DNA_ID=CAMNT_0010415099 /DNA_START=224 /DNA_END=853 /DNA_ORIENTATION=+
MKSTAWVEAESPDYHFWIGISGVVWESNTNSSVSRNTRWSDVNCDRTYDNRDNSDENEDDCNTCRRAALGSVTTVIMSLVTSIPQLMTDIQRSHPEGDLNCQKILGVVTGIMGFVTTLAAINTFVIDCRENLTTTDPNGNSITYKWGPSLVLLTLATFAKLLDVVVHLVLPVPSRDTVEKMKVEDGPTKPNAKDVQMVAVPDAKPSGSV